MKLSKQFYRRVWAAVRTIVIFAPLIIAVVWLVQFDRGTNRALLSFNQIHQNIFVVNDVLLAFIVASYGVVFLGLCFYFWGAVGDLNKYTGSSNTVKLLNALCLILLFAVFATLILYLFIMLATCSGWWSESIHEKLNIETIVVTNKYLSLGIFLVFLIADLFAWKSQALQQKENHKKLNDAPHDTHLKHSIAQTSDQIQLSRNATFLVNIPTVLLTASMVILSSYVSKAARFRGSVDHHLHYLEVKNFVGEETFGLFLNGLEAGVIVCTIIYSQIIYVIIRTRWEPK